MGHPPLDESNDFTELRDWLKEKGIRKIDDISEWDTNGNWLQWNLPRPPEHLYTQLASFKNAISDYAPVHKDEEDHWGWGKTGVYTAKQGYL